MYGHVPQLCQFTRGYVPFLIDGVSMVGESTVALRSCCLDAHPIDSLVLHGAVSRRPFMIAMLKHLRLMAFLFVSDG